MCLAALELGPGAAYATAEDLLLVSACPFRAYVGATLLTPACRVWCATVLQDPAMRVIIHSNIRPTTSRTWLLCLQSCAGLDPDQ